MDKYNTFKNTALRDALNKASEQGHSVGKLVKQADKNRMAKRYARQAKENNKLNSMARECIRKDMERHAKPVTIKDTIQPVTIKDTIGISGGMTYELNPNHANYENVKTMAKERMLSYIVNFASIHERWIYDSTDKLGLACWKDSYLLYTHEINAYQQTYRLAKMIFETAITQSDNPLFDPSMQHMKRDIWDLLVLDCGNEHNALVTGWIITDIVYKAWLPNRIELPQNMKGQTP